MAIELYGYRYSVYAWIARLALHEKGLTYDWVEVDPFADEVPANYLAKHPFKRVPALVHDGFVIYETNAITRYIDEVFEGLKFQSLDPRERARINQIVSVIDNYAYWPLVRQVFSHGIFLKRMGLEWNESELKDGLNAAPKVLAALERLAGGGDYLIGERLSLADIHFAPMIGYFILIPEGEILLTDYPRLNFWWSAISKRQTYIETRPALPKPLS